MKDEKERSKIKTFFHNLFIRYGHITMCVIIIVTIIILMSYNRTTYKENIIALESKMTEKMDEQADFILENTKSLYAAGFAEVISKIEDADASFTSGFNNTNGRIQRINAVYSGLLTEMEKKTLDSLYTEASLIDMEKEAKVLFSGKNYAGAYAQYAVLAEAQPENTDARFYCLYSLFMNNRMNRSNYPQIKEGMLALEKNGYIRSEIKEVLEFIDTEENGFVTEILE